MSEAKQQPGWLHSPASGVLFAATAALLWSTSGLLIKVVTVDPFALSMVRSGIAALVMLPFFRLRTVRLEPWLLVLLVAYTFTTLMFVVATRLTTASNAIAMQSTAPAWVFLYSVLAARRLPGWLMLPIAFILSGIVAILSEPVAGTSQTGNVLGLMTGISFAVGQVALSRLHQPVLSIVFLSNLTAALVCMAFFPEARKLGGIGLSEWLALIYLGVFQIGLGFVLFTLALRRISVTQASILSVLEPMFNPLWVYLAVAEVPSGHGLAGWGLILAGIATDIYLRWKGHQMPGPRGLAGGPA